MKHFKGVYLIMIVAILSASLLVGCATVASTLEEKDINSETQNVETDLYGAAAAAADNEMTVEEMLIYAVQDEYLAHGEYAYILDTFGDQNPFANIIKAEEQHIASLKEAFDANGYVAPEDLSKNHLILPGSVQEALETGVQAEIVNIEMYDLFLNKDLPQDIELLFTSLRDASKNHLTAFEKKSGQ